MNKDLIIYFDSLFLQHYDPTASHVENPIRLDIAFNSLNKFLSKESIKVDIRGAVKYGEDLLLLVHDSDYVSFIKDESRKGFHYIDPDTYVNEHTFDVALAAFSTAYQASNVALQEGINVLVLVRPPGHHSGIRGKALGAPTNGFCIFNNSAAAVISALRNVRRVLVIDFDAHHGNGTQEIFWDNGRVVHVDIHERGIYPGTGDLKDLGGKNAEGTKINIPLDPLSNDIIYMWVLRNIIEVVVCEFKPDFLVISAGFDAYRTDPLTDLSVTEITYEAYGYLVNKLLRKGVVKGTVTVLEGGYGDGLRKGLIAYVKGYIKPGINEEVIDELSEKGLRKYNYLISKIKRILGDYWSII